MAEGVQNAGSIARDSGMNFELLAASIGKLSEVTRQDGSQVGTALKTMMARISRSKDADVDVTAEDRSDAAKALKQYADIDVYDASGNYKDLGNILDSLAGKWDKLTSAQQANVAEALGGVRGVNNVRVLIDQWEEIRELEKGALTDTDFYESVQEKSMDSLESKMDTLKATTQDFFYNILDKDLIGNGVNAISGLVGALNGLLKVIGNFQSLSGIGYLGLLVGAGSLIGGWDTAQEKFRSKIQSGQSANFITELMSGMSNQFKGASSLGISKKAQDAYQARAMLEGSVLKGTDLTWGKAFKYGANAAIDGRNAQSLDEMVKALDTDKLKSIPTLFKEIWSSGDTMGSKLKSSFSAIGTGFKSLWSSMGTFSKLSVGLTAAFAAFEAGKMAFDAMSTTWDEATTKVESLNSAMSEEREQAKSLKEFTTSQSGVRLDELTNKMGESAGLSLQELDEYHDLCNELAQISPNLVAGFDSQNNAILNITASTQNLNAEYERLALNMAKTRVSEAGDRLKPANQASGNKSWLDEAATRVEDFIRGFKGETLDVADAAKLFDNLGGRLEMAKKLKEFQDNYLAGNDFSFDDINEVFSKSELDVLGELPNELFDKANRIMNHDQLVEDFKQSIDAGKFTEVIDQLSASQQAAWSEVQQLMLDQLDIKTADGLLNISDVTKQSVKNLIGRIPMEAMPFKEGEDITADMLGDYVENIAKTIQNTPSLQDSLTELLSFDLSNISGSAEIEKVIEDINKLAAALNIDAKPLAENMGLGDIEQISSKVKEIEQLAIKGFGTAPTDEAFWKSFTEGKPIEVDLSTDSLEKSTAQFADSYFDSMSHAIESLTTENNKIEREQEQAGKARNMNAYRQTEEYQREQARARELAQAQADSEAAQKRRIEQIEAETAAQAESVRVSKLKPKETLDAQQATEARQGKDRLINEGETFGTDRIGQMAKEILSDLPKELHQPDAYMPSDQRAGYLKQEEIVNAAVAQQTLNTVAKASKDLMDSVKLESTVTPRPQDRSNRDAIEAQQAAAEAARVQKEAAENTSRLKQQAIADNAKEAEITSKIAETNKKISEQQAAQIKLNNDQLKQKAIQDNAEEQRLTNRNTEPTPKYMLNKGESGFFGTDANMQNLVRQYDAYNKTNFAPKNQNVLMDGLDGGAFSQLTEAQKQAISALDENTRAVGKNTTETKDANDLQEEQFKRRTPDASDVKSITGDKRYASNSETMEDLNRHGWQFKTSFQDGYFAQTYSKDDGSRSVVMTPVLPDGTKLSPDELQNYANQLLAGEQIDVDGITLGVWDGDDSVRQAKSFDRSLADSAKRTMTNRDLMREIADLMNNLDISIPNLDYVTQALQDAIDRGLSFDDFKADLLATLYDAEREQERINELWSNTSTARESIDSMWSARSESNSSTGLSKASYDQLDKIFSGTSGYDRDKLFGLSAASGIHINEQAYKQIEKQWKTEQLEKYTSEVKHLEETYASLCQEIAEAGGQATTSQLAQRDAVRAQIDEAKAAQAEFEGLINSVTEFKRAGSETQVYDDYSYIQSKQESMQELNDKHLYGNTEYQKYIETFSSPDIDFSTWTGQDYADAFAEAQRKSQRYITEDLVTGVSNFVNDLIASGPEFASGSMEEGFEINASAQDIAKNLGISEAAVDQVFNALKGLGVPVEFTLDSPLKDLKDKATEAAKELGHDLGDIEVDGKSYDQISDKLEELKNKKQELADQGLLGDEEGKAYDAEIAYLSAALGELQQKAGIDLEFNIRDNLDQINDDFNYLKSLDKDLDFELRLDTTNIDVAQTDLHKMEQYVKDNFTDPKTGRINFEMDGAVEATNIMIALKNHLSELEQPAILKADVSGLGDAERTAVESIQRVVSLMDELDMLEWRRTVGIDTDDTSINACKEKISEAVKELAATEKGKDIIISLGLDPNTNEQELAQQIDEKVQNMDLPELSKLLNINLTTGEDGDLEINTTVERSQFDQLKADVEKGGTYSITTEVDGKGANSQQESRSNYTGDKTKTTSSKTRTTGLNSGITANSSFGGPTNKFYNLENPGNVYPSFNINSAAQNASVKVDADTSGAIKETGAVTKYVESQNPEMNIDGNASNAESEAEGAAKTVEGLNPFMQILADASGATSEGYTTASIIGGLMPMLMILGNASGALATAEGTKGTIDMMTALLQILGLGDDAQGVAQGIVDFVTGSSPTMNIMGNVQDANAKANAASQNAADKKPIIYIGGDNRSAIASGNTAFNAINGKRAVINVVASGINAIIGQLNSIRDKTVTVTTVHRSTGGGGGHVEQPMYTGSAITSGGHHAIGRAMVQGSHGDWGVKRGGRTLVGELGPEVLVRSGKYYTVGNNGAEFVNLRQNDVIFNHKQSENLFKYGRIDSRGEIVGSKEKIANFFGGLTPTFPYQARGTAMVGGGYIGKFTLPRQTVQAIQQAVATAPATAKPTNTVKAAAPKSQAAQKEAEKFRETLDWVEVLIDRLERKISQLDTVASSVFKTATERTAALSDEFTKVREEVEISSRALETYQKRMDSIGLSQTYIDKIKNGKLEIEDINNEDVYKKIQEYQEWYEKYLDIFYKVTDLHEQLGEIVKANFDLIESNYSTMVESIEYEIEKLESSMDILTKEGMYAGEAYYVALMNKEVEIMNKLNEEYESLTDVRKQALETGEIAEGSEADLEMLNTIRDIESAWVDAKSSYLEYRNSMREADWEIFEKVLEYVSDINNEIDFMIGLLSEVENKLYDEDTGRFTDQGMIVGALHAQDYEIYMRKAQAYGDEIKKINDELADDPNNVILLDKKQEYIQAQRDSIQAAMDEKEAIQALTKESYDRMIESLEKIIDKRREALEAEKDLYDYSRNIKDQTENIASLRKQLLSIEFDDSEEAKSRRQTLQEKLQNAEEELEATEYERYIQDQERLWDNVLTEFEEYLNKRLDDLDGLLQDMITYANENSENIANTLVETSDKVGYDLSQGLEQTWRNTSDNLKTVLTGVDADFADWKSTFSGTMTTTNNYIQAIFQILKKATKSTVVVDNVHGVTTEEDLKPKPAPTPAPAPATPAKTPTSSGSSSNSTPKVVQIGSKVRVAASEPIYYDSYGTVGPNGSVQYFRNDPVYYVMGENNGYWLLRHHTESTAAGWFRKSAVTAMKTGGYTGNQDGYALLHKKERVLSAAQTKAFENLIYNQLPELMNLKLDTKSYLSGQASNIANNIQMEFNLPNVTDVQSFMKELQNNKQFEKLIQAMTIDQLNNKNSLRKKLIKF